MLRSQQSSPQLSKGYRSPELRLLRCPRRRLLIARVLDDCIAQKRHDALRDSGATERLRSRVDTRGFRCSLLGWRRNHRVRKSRRYDQRSLLLARADLLADLLTVVANSGILRHPVVRSHPGYDDGPNYCLRRFLGRSHWLLSRLFSFPCGQPFPFRAKSRARPDRAVTLGETGWHPKRPRLANIPQSVSVT